MTVEFRIDRSADMKCVRVRRMDLNDVRCGFTECNIDLEKDNFRFLFSSNRWDELSVSDYCAYFLASYFILSNTRIRERCKTERHTRKNTKAVPRIKLCWITFWFLVSLNSIIFYTSLLCTIFFSKKYFEVF